MSTFTKKRLHAAVAAALTGVASVAVTDQAMAQLANTNVGQTLLFPYYTVNNGWVTTIKAINTSDATLAVKVRFHESKNSRDVLDFNVIMSPHDVWSGWVQEGASGAPQFHTSDASCTSPQVVEGASASSIAYTGQFDDTGGAGVGRMREGYVELLVMGIAEAGQEDSEDNPTAYNAKHVDGVPRDCSIVDARFLAQAPAWTADTDPATYTSGQVCPDTAYGGPYQPGSGDPLAACDFIAPAGVFPLKGNLSWLHASTGTGAGTEAIAVGTETQGDWSALNMVTAQVFPWFLEPTFASINGLWTVDGVTDYEPSITFSSTLNEWANNPANGAVVDWVVNFPTKGYHVDKFNNQIQAAVSKYRNALADVVTCADNTTASRGTCTDVGAPTTVAPFENLFGVQGTGDSKITVTYNLFDSEETGESLGSTVISPAPPGEVGALQWEANVLQFGSEPVLDSTKAVAVDASSLLPGAPTTGWANVTFGAPLPVVGFAVKSRDRGEPSTAYGQSMDNGYTGLAVE